MSHITTYSGEDFDPLHPDATKIQIADIAHALSMLCRANGHLRQFYSVAQHCINCASEARARSYSKKVQLACLLHDASEAYIADINRPVKPYLSNYMEIEEQLQSLIYSKYIMEPLSSEDLSQVRQIDDLLLVCELNALMSKPVFAYQPDMVGDINLEFENFESVNHQYLNLWAGLTGQKLEYNLLAHPFLSVGIDGCKGKWLATAISHRGYEVSLFDTVGEVCAHFKDADSILIDMPIGLAEDTEDIRPDVDLRRHLKGKTSSVFNTPCRQAVYQTEYAEASNVNYEIMGTKLSQQSFAILPKIREIDHYLQTYPEWKNRLLESHPEYCFSLLNAGRPVLENKKTADGAAKRLTLLSKYYPQSQELLKAFKFQYPSLSSQTDDLLDALSLAIIGAIGLKEGFHSIPRIPSEDAKAIKMQIIGANL